MIKKTLKWFLSFYEETQPDPPIQKPVEEPEKITKEQAMKELLRENLALVNLDIFYIDDPLLAVPQERRAEYLKKFWDLCADKDIMEWFRYLINKQVRLTMQLSKDSVQDPNGAMNINGIATVKDTFEKLANTYVKESVPDPDFNPYQLL